MGKDLYQFDMDRGQFCVSLKGQVYMGILILIRDMGSFKLGHYFLLHLVPML